MSGYYPEQVWNSEDDERYVEDEFHKYARLTKGMARRDVLLLLIEQACTAIGDYFVPSAYTMYVRIGREHLATMVGGSGDAAALRGLERRGLIERPPESHSYITEKYAYRITESGKLRAQEIA